MKKNHGRNPIYRLVSYPSKNYNIWRIFSGNSRESSTDSNDSKNKYDLSLS